MRRGRPLVSVVLTTRDRPRFLRTALRCYRHQTYGPRELFVIDDGERFPADRRAVEAAGGRLIRVDRGTPIGAKLNAGVRHARGVLCQKVDDDDWYGKRFLATMVDALLPPRAVVCRPGVAFVTPFLLFDVAAWQLRVSQDRNIPGATLLFSREDWEAAPFRNLRSHEDIWFLMDQRRRGVELLPVWALEQFIAVRHGPHSDERGHTWTHNPDGEVLEHRISRLRPHVRGPEAFLPRWAMAFYRRLHQEMAATPSGTGL